MKKLPLSLFLAFVLCSPTFAGNEKKTLTVKAITHESQEREYKYTAPGGTNCSGTGTPDHRGELDIHMDCNTTPPQDHVIGKRIKVVNVVEGDGNDYTISCTANGVGSNCSMLRDGDLFEAKIDGTTMWLHGRKEGNQGKPVTVKYGILDIRPAPLREGAVKPLQSSQAAPLPTQRALDTSIPDSGPPGLKSQGQPGIGPGEDGGVGEGVFRPRGGVSVPLLVSKVDPDYSAEALTAKCHGTVLVSVTIQADGQTGNIRVVKTDEIFCDNVSDAGVTKALAATLGNKAAEAVKQWRFRPGQKNGTAVDVAATIEITFRL